MMPDDDMDGLRLFSMREQVEREIADDCDAQYRERAGPPDSPRRLDAYGDGWCTALDMFERRIRSGAYRKDGK
jgi:hypothetical protein